MEPPPLAGRIMALAAARSTPKEDSRLMRRVSSNSAWLVVWAEQRVDGKRGIVGWRLHALLKSVHAPAPAVAEGRSGSTIDPNGGTGPTPNSPANQPVPPRRPHLT